LRASLWLLLFPAGLFAMMSLATGLTFGFALWSARDPLPTVLWFATLAFPFLIKVAIDMAQSTRRLLFSALACWGCAAWYLFALPS
jgi:hypothetical protein